MRLKATKENKTFAQRIAIFTEYIAPFRQMWPYYWLKVAAIRDPQRTTWQLRYFALVGHWSERKPIPEIHHTADNAILAISQLIDAETAWRVLVSLQTNGTMEPLPGIIIEAVPEPDATYPSTRWQEALPFAPKALEEVAEPARWLYLYTFELRRQELGKPLPGEEKHMMEERVRTAVQDDVEMLSLNDFGHFTATYLGLGYGGQDAGCSLDDFLYQFDLPLAFRVERGVPNRAANTLPLDIYCQRPLALEELEVRAGELRPHAELCPVTIETSPEQGWSVGRVVVPYTCGKVWFKFGSLDKVLTYEIPQPTRTDQLTDVLGSLYQASSTDQGKAKWRTHLLESDGTNFEIALLNALARFGMSVFFAGQVQQDAKTGGGGTSTPGYDLIMHDRATSRVILISAKGSGHVPNDEMGQKLLDAVESIQQLLPGWVVQGIIACHAPNNKLSRLKAQTAFRVWGREDLEVIGLADSWEAVAWFF